MIKESPLNLKKFSKYPTGYPVKRIKYGKGKRDN